MLCSTDGNVRRNYDRMFYPPDLDGNSHLLARSTRSSGIPAHGVLEEFQRAYKDIVNDPRTIPVWQPIIAKYSPAFLGECEKAITWSTSLVDAWLKRNMLAAEPEKDAIVGIILRELGDHSVSLAHNRHLSAAKCKEIGLKVYDLESDQKLQDKILSVHHIYFHTLSSTPHSRLLRTRMVWRSSFKHNTS